MHLMCVHTTCTTAWLGLQITHQTRLGATQVAASQRGREATGFSHRSSAKQECMTSPHVGHITVLCLVLLPQQQATQDARRVKEDPHSCRHAQPVKHAAALRPEAGGQTRCLVCRGQASVQGSTISPQRSSCAITAYSSNHVRALHVRMHARCCPAKRA